VVPKIALYGPLAAPYTEKCRLALILKGLRFDLHEPEGPEDYRRWSPRTGLLPVMTVDDELVADSTDILLRLDEIRPEPRLLSADPLIAAQQRNLEDWADESFLWYWHRWQHLARERGGKPAGGGRLGTLGLGARRALAAWKRSHATILRGVDDRLNDLVNFLGSRPYFYSDQPGMADLTVYGMLFTLRRDSIPGSARLLAARPPLLAFMRRVEKRTGG
jgi:glutathione S-transferase